jgi:hypothetical protein
MKSVFSLTAVALLCASTSFAQQAPTPTDLIQGQSGEETVDGGALLLGLGGLGAAAVAGIIVAGIVVVGAVVDNNSTNGTN